VFVAEPVSWSEAPGNLRTLARQRRRRHRGLTEILTKHRGAIGNPRYGRIGLLSLPYYVVFELLAPLVELLGLVMLPFAVGGALLAPSGERQLFLDFVWRFMCVTYGYGMLLNLVALAVEEYSFHRYSRWGDLGAAVLASILENVGYRQLTALWRIHGMWSALTGTRQVWGAMTRTGFGDKADR
jgi:hypothetical protein